MLPVASLAACRSGAAIGQVSQFVGCEACGQTRRFVQRRLRPGRFEARQQFAVSAFWLDLAFGAEMTEPAVTEADMADLIAQDDVQDAGAGVVAGSFQLSLYGRRGIEAPRFE